MIQDDERPLNPQDERDVPPSEGREGRTAPAGSTTAPYTVVACVLDRNASIRETAGAIQELLGMAPEQLTGVALTSLARHEDRPRLQAAFDSALRGTPQIIFAELRRASAVCVAVSLSLTAMAVDGDVVGVHAVLTNVARSGEHDLRQQRVYRMEIVGRLAAGLAHDLNNRLLVIRGRARFALDELPPASPVRAHLQEVSRSADRAEALTRQLLAFGRRQETAARLISLNDIITGMDTLLDRLVGDSIPLTLQLDPGLWTTVVDQVQIEQMLLNLVLNAKDAMPNGGELTIATCNVRVPTEALRTPAELPHGDYVQLVVRDTGRGMDAQTLLRAFDPFFTTRDMTERTGLGLTCVYAIVQQARGVLDIDSAPGAGTTFAVYLPRATNARAAAVAETTPPVVSRQAAQEPTDGSRTILVVDDEAPVRTLVRLVLEGRGFRVLDARHGPDALLLAEIQRTPIDLLITDIAMPEMNGVDLAIKLRAQFPALQVVFMSGYMAETLVERESVPAEEILVQKPFDLSTLLGAVGNALGMELSA